MSTWSSKKIPCPICGEEINQGNKSRHIKNNHPDQHGNSSYKPSIQGVIRENHPQEQEDLKQFDPLQLEIPQSRGIPDNEPDSPSESESDDDNRKKITINTPQYAPQPNPKILINNALHQQRQRELQQYQKQEAEKRRIYALEQQRVYNSQRDRKLKELEASNKSLREMVDGLSKGKGDQEKIMRKMEDLQNKNIQLENELTNTSIELERIKDKGESIEKSYQKASKKEQEKIKKLASNNPAIIKYIEACSKSCEECYRSIQSDKERISRIRSDLEKWKIEIETRVSAMERRMDTQDKFNRRIEQDVNNNKEKLDRTIKDKPSRNDVINLIYLILDRTDVKVNKDMIKDLLEGKIEKPKVNTEKVNAEKIEEPENIEGGSSKEISKHFNEEMNELINKMRLTKKDDLNKTTIKSMKKIIEKHSQIGHLNEIKKYMENLPKNKSQKNKKKAVMRKHLHTTIKNIEVK